MINFIEQYKHLSLLRYHSCGVLRRSRLVSGVAMVGGNTMKNVIPYICEDGTSLYQPRSAPKKAAILRESLLMLAKQKQQQQQQAGH